MAPSKRRKGKQATSRSTATRQSTTAASTDNKKGGAVQEGAIGGSSSGAATRADPPAPTIIDDENDIILTSSKRKGVYECDFCKGDISQLPRIRCAVCDDFDLCLDCFTTKLGNQATLPSSSPLKKHIPTKHGYRVCDSTKFPIFPTARQWSTKSFAQSVGAQVPSSALSKSATPSNKATLNGNGGIMSTPRKTLGGDDAGNNTAEDTAKKDSSKQIENSEISGDDPLEGDPMEVDSSLKEKKETDMSEHTASTPAPSTGGYTFRAEDPKVYWTVEEDLRLIEGIQNHGIGNWVEIAETVSGPGKTSKRCMERYLDDYLGRYGHILPMYMLIPYEDSCQSANDLGGLNDENNATGNNTDQTNNTTAPEESTTAANRDSGGDANMSGSSTGLKSSINQPTAIDSSSGLEDLPRISKRRATHFRSPLSTGTTNSNNYASTLASRKKYKVVPTESIEGYQNIWPKPYLPSTRPNIGPGVEVGRDQMYKAEQAFVKAITAVQTEEEANAIHKEWAETRLKKPNGPTVLPPRPEDVMTMPGAELAGFMPRREDFDIEWENDAEEAIGDMEFLPNDSEEDKKLKLKVLEIYNAKLDKRESRKKFIISRKLWDYRKLHHDFEKLPRDERDLILRMRLFERFHTPEEHKIFLDDILKAKRLRKEIAKLQMYRRLGIRTLVEAEKYELDKARRQFHKSVSSASSQNKDGNGAQRSTSDPGGGTGKDRKSTTGIKFDETTPSTLLWRQYRPSERRDRRSGSRGVSFGITGSLSDSRTDHPAKEAATSGPADVEAGGNTNDEFDLKSQPSTLSTQEGELCAQVGLTHDQYRDIKRVLIQESLEAGLLDKESAGSSRRSLIKMDIVRRGNLIDFFLRAGWVSTRLSHIARSLPYSQPHS